MCYFITILDTFWLNNVSSSFAIYLPEKLEIKVIANDYEVRIAEVAQTNKIYK